MNAAIRFSSGFAYMNSFVAGGVYRRLCVSYEFLSCVVHNFVLLVTVRGPGSSRDVV